MTDKAASQFVYVTYIRASAEALWSALTTPDITKQFWFGVHQDSTWTAGAPWRLVFADGRVADAGTVVEIDPPRRIVIAWHNVFKPELAAEGVSRCVLEIEPAGEAVKLTVLHTMDREGSLLIGAVSGGWPRILSNLKSLLETGTVVLP